MKNFKDRYWLFLIYAYSAAGGLDDLSFTSNELSEVMDRIESENKKGWTDEIEIQVYDTEEKQIVYHNAYGDEIICLETLPPKKH